VIQDLNPDLLIHLDLYQGVRWIAPEMHWIHSLVWISQFTEFCVKRPVTVRDTVINLKCIILQWWGNWKSDPESALKNNHDQEVDWFFPQVGPTITPSYDEIVILMTNKTRHTDWQRYNQGLSYFKQIAHQLCTQYVDGIYDNPMTLKSRLSVTQGHWKRNHWTDHTRLTIGQVIWRWILFVTLKCRLEVTQDHWKWYHLKALVRFPWFLP